MNVFKMCDCQSTRSIFWKDFITEFSISKHAAYLLLLHFSIITPFSLPWYRRAFTVMRPR